MNGTATANVVHRNSGIPVNGTVRIVQAVVGTGVTNNYTVKFAVEK